MNRKILAIALILSMTTMPLIIPTASVSGQGIPNPDTITYSTIGGSDTTGGSDPAWAYDTASCTMIQQVYEPLFMYENTSLTSFKPILADWWNGYTGDGNSPGGSLVPLHPSVPAELAVLTEHGITPPAGTEEAWLFHIRANVHWQDPTYGTVKPSDVAYSIQRGMLQDAFSDVQWMMYGPLLQVGYSTYWDTNHNGTIDRSEYNGASGLGNAVKNVIQANDGTGYVAFFLPAPYVPFMQILTQSWAMVTCKAWVMAHGGIDTGIALSNNLNNYTEFLSHYQPDVSPLMEPSVVGSVWPMMGSGPYRLVVYNTDPHTGFERFQRNPDYWQGWTGHPYAEYIVIKIVEEWANRKFQFLSTSSTQADLTDVPIANYAELHVGGNKDGATLPGISLTKLLLQTADYYFYNYQVGAESAFMPTWGNGTEVPTLFSDRNLREAFMYCFNDSQFLQQYFLGEAIQPTTFMCNGTVYYNGSIPVRQYNLDQAVAHFQKAWGGQVWSQGITVKLVYNIANIARQTIANMISDTVARINSLYGTNLNVIADGEPWAIYLPALHNKQLPCFTVGWWADYPDPDDWAVPFMASYGAWTGWQSITYGLNYTSLNEAWAGMTPHATWGPMPFTDPLGKVVTGLNNSYVDNLIRTAVGLTDVQRGKVY
ncbi:MAG TPA: ABC transporter substrate-binding protein, partial [Acidobacteriota bacterium]|nr:ABC transporter substrate-binding protein [Acidobacteriota bacterium]